MKKIVSVLLSVCMLVGAFTISSVDCYAETVESLEVSGVKYNVTAGDCIDAYPLSTISVSGNGHDLRIANSYIGQVDDGNLIYPQTDVFVEGTQYILLINVESGTDRSYDNNVTVSPSTFDYNILDEHMILLACPIGVKAIPEPTPEPDEHTHEFVEGIITEPTCNSDGLESIYCKTCGYVKESSPISAFGYALYGYGVPLIKGAQSGQTVVFEFGEWNSFPDWFMKEIANRRDVTFVFRYKWNHVQQEIMIPAGSEVYTQFLWTGPAKMRELYVVNQ